MTTRGFTELESEQLANLIANVLEAPYDASNIARVTEKVGALCRRFPVYGS
jgi:glycine hydroxymethyltransferase